MTESHSSNFTTAMTQDDDGLQQAKHNWIVANFALIGIIVMLGFCLNFLALAIFLRSPSFRITTSARYFIALCAADNINLLGEFLKWLNTEYDDGTPILAINFGNTNHNWCVLIYFLRYYGKFASVWLTVAITIERFLVAAFPLRVTTLSTVRTTTIVICIIYLLGFAVNAPVYWMLQIWPQRGCVSAFKYDEWNKAVNICGTIATPHPLIFLFTCLLLYKLRRMHKTRTQLTTNNDSSGIQRQLTAMLLTVAITTIVFRLPYTIMYQIYTNQLSIWRVDKGKWFDFRLKVILDVCYLPVVINYTINFFLFYITGGIFRNNLMSCIKCEKPGTSSKRVQQTRMTFLTNTTGSNSNVSMSLIKGSTPSPRIARNV